MEQVEVAPEMQQTSAHYVHLESVLNRPKMDVVAAGQLAGARHAVSTPGLAGELANQLQGQTQKGDGGFQMTQIVFPNHLDSRYSSFDSQENKREGSSYKKVSANNNDLRAMAKAGAAAISKTPTWQQAAVAKPKLFKNVDIKVKIYQKAFETMS